MQRDAIPRSTPEQRRRGPVLIVQFYDGEPLPRVFLEARDSDEESELRRVAGLLVHVLATMRARHGSVLRAW
jgi:hypothetical protein